MKAGNETKMGAIRRFVRAVPWALMAGTIAALVLITPARAAEQASPAERIEAFHAKLLEVMREAKSLGYEGRYQTLEPAVRTNFALDFMARVVAGRYWSALSDEERERLVDAFTRMTVATYASRFDGYGGENFRTLSVEDAPQDTKLVRTQLVKSDGSTVDLDYLVRPGDGGWQVVDIYLDGTVSELATRRSEYASLLKNHGLDGLVRRIDDRIAEMRTTQH